MEERGGISVRPLRMVEVPAYMALRREIEKESKHVVGNGGRRESLFLTLARMFVNRRHIFTFVATDNGKLVGYLTLIFARLPKMKGNGYLGLSVKASHRNRGIGTILMEAAEKLARGRNVRRLELEVFSKNRKAIDLYKRLGYVEEGRKKHAVETQEGLDDMVFMAKLLR